METNFNLKEALKETNKHYSLKEKAEIILQIINCKMKEQDISADTVATIEIKCKLDSDTHFIDVPRLYEIIASVTYLSGKKMEIYKTNLTLMQRSEKRILMKEMAMKAECCKFVYGLFDKDNGDLELRILL